MPVPPPVEDQVEESVVVEEQNEVVEQPVPVKYSTEPKESSSFKNVSIKKGKFEVIALRDGFVSNIRIPEGSVFTITDWAKLGSWMKCVDPQMEKQHQAEMKERKEKIAGK